MVKEIEMVTIIYEAPIVLTDNAKQILADTIQGYADSGVDKGGWDDFKADGGVHQVKWVLKNTNAAGVHLVEIMQWDDKIVVH